MEIIATVKSPFHSKFAIPRQSGVINEIESLVIFEKKYQNPDYIRCLESFSHLWIIWEFSQSKDHTAGATVRPPKLGGNTRVGVFASRSPFRPNPIGLSLVKLEQIEYTKDSGPVLHIKGADIMNQTPVLDIKPYLAYCDCVPNASSGFSPSQEEFSIDVEIPEKFLKLIKETDRKIIYEILKQDPRPGYKTSDEREYRFEFSIYKISFKVKDNLLQVTNISLT